MTKVFISKQTENKNKLEEGERRREMAAAAGSALIYMSAASEAVRSSIINQEVSLEQEDFIKCKTGLSLLSPLVAVHEIQINTH